MCLSQIKIHPLLPSKFPQNSIGWANGMLIVPSIVFVHGLNGDRHDTWTKSVTNSNVKRTHDQAFNASSSSGWRQRLGIGPRASSSSPAAEVQEPNQVKESLEVFWPEDFLPQAIPDCRIASWGYNVDLRVTRRSTSTATVFDHARTLLSDLADVRVTEDERKRPIIFVAHSLGGIVVKDVRAHPTSGSVKPLLLTAFPEHRILLPGKCTTFKIRDDGELFC